MLNKIKYSIYVYAFKFFVVFEYQIFISRS